jgi:hypothetical protein
MNFRHATAVGLVALALAAPAQADVGPYIGAKAGLMDADASGHDEALNIGGVFGYRFFDDNRGSGSLEGELTLSGKDGDTPGGGDWDVTTVAAYFAYRTPGEFYFKGKAGFADQNVGGTSAIDDETGLSFGVGGGWQIDRKASLEVEYTVYDDLKFISVGFNTRF